MAWDWQPITSHHPDTPSPGEEVVLWLEGNLSNMDFHLEYFDDGWKIIRKSEMVLYQNAIGITMPNILHENKMVVVIVIDPYSSNPTYSDNYTFNFKSPPPPEIMNHSPKNPSPGEEVTLSFRENFLGADLDLEYRSGSKWQVMPKSEVRLYANAVEVRIPPTFNEDTMTVRSVVGSYSNPMYSPSYTFNIALPKDRIQYNQSGTIRNMEAKYNHNGVIKDVECWYNHNGVLKKVQ